jgi:transposase
MRELGEDVSEQLGFVPGYFEVIRHVRPKLSCAQCSRIVQMPAPARPIEHAAPTAGLLAQVIVAKYADHLPLYRQAGIYRRAGVQLERSTLASWVGQVADLLDPLVGALSDYVLAAEKLHADDTPIPVLDPGRGRTQTGRIWTYLCARRAARGRAGSPSGVVPLLPGPQGRASARASAALPWDLAGRWLCGLRRALPGRGHYSSRSLGGRGS